MVVVVITMVILKQFKLFRKRQKRNLKKNIAKKTKTSKKKKTSKKDNYHVWNPTSTKQKIAFICDHYENDNYEKKNANSELQRVLCKKCWCKDKDMKILLRIPKSKKKL
jgi:mannitol-specific phosphotransferase system IIBC component